MFAAIGALLSLVLLLATGAGAWAKPAVMDVRLGVHPDSTRIVLDLSERPGYRVFTLSDPYRVVLDLTEVDWKLAGGRPPRGAGLVEALRYGLFAVGTSRVVFDVSGPVRVRHVEMLAAANGKPIRLVLDLEAVAPTGFEKTQQSSAVVPASVAMPAPPPAASPAAPTAPPLKPPMP